MNDDLNGMFRELKEIEAAISQSREMVEVIQKHLDILPSEFLRDVQKVIAPLDVARSQSRTFRVGDRVRAKDTGHIGEIVDLFTVTGTGKTGTEVLWDTGIHERMFPDELEHERERDQP